MKPISNEPADRDGPAVALVGLVFLVVFYGGAIWFLQRMYKAARENQNPAAGTRGATVPRKAAQVTMLTAVIGGFLYWQFADRLAERAPSLPPAPQAAQAAPTDPISEQLKIGAAEISSKGPQKLDPITTLSRSTAEGRTLIYHYIMSRRDGSDDAFRAFVRRNTLPKVCGDSDMRSAMDDYEVVYSYSYTFPKSQAPVIIDVTSQACRS